MYVRSGGNSAVLMRVMGKYPAYAVQIQFFRIHFVGRPPFSGAVSIAMIQMRYGITTGHNEGIELNEGRRLACAISTLESSRLLERDRETLLSGGVTPGGGKGE